MQPSEDNSDGIREPLVIRLPGSVDRIYQRFTDDSKGYLRRSNKGNQINADEYSGRTGSTVGIGELVQTGSGLANFGALGRDQRVPPI